MNTVTDELMSRRDVAQLFRCSVMSVIRWEASGILTPIRLGKLVRYRRAEIAAYVAANTRKAISA